jgi:hypothetical protein
MRSSVYSHTFSTNSTGTPLLDPRAFELLQHYARVASFTLSTKGTLDIWKFSIPEEAKTHQFLMHSLLALSALHLSYVRIDNRDEYVYYANKEHEDALACFRSSVGSIDCGNGNAVMAFSFLTVVFSIGLPLVYGFARTQLPTTAFIQIMNVLRGAHSAANPVLPGVKKGALGPLIEIRQQQGKPKTCPMHRRGAEVLDNLYSYIETCDESEEYKPIYRDGVTSLYNFLKSMADAPPSWANYLSWPVSVSPSFFKLLQEERPFPLIILATWCVGLWRSPNLWFNAWSKRIVSNIYHQLEGEAKEAVRWPAEQVGVIPLHLHQQPCLCLACRSCADCQEESSEYHRPRHPDPVVEYLPLRTLPERFIQRRGDGGM